MLPLQVRRNHETYKVLLCQCNECLDIFSIQARVKHNHIVKLDPHQRVIIRKGKVPCHNCGGLLSFFPTQS